MKTALEVVQQKIAELEAKLKVYKEIETDLVEGYFEDLAEKKPVKVPRIHNIKI
jgi:hypothetical protein